MKIIRAGDRFHIQSDWLSAYWLFSFDRYYDPSNVSFGSLRVFNHDTISGGGGFPTHSHREMEIVTYGLSGELSHKDSTGGRGIIGQGEVQAMTAGTGVAHSEFNASETIPATLLQIWVKPRETGLTPRYEQKRFNLDDRKGKLLPIASGQEIPDAVLINQDTTFYVSHLESGDVVKYSLDDGRRVFFYVIEGEISLNGEKLEAGDQARINVASELKILGLSTSEIILIDLK